MNSIQEAGIILTTYSDYFNSKSRNHLPNLINVSEYNIIFDSCENIGMINVIYNYIKTNILQTQVASTLMRILLQLLFISCQS